MMAKRVFGKELIVGDTVEVWWQPGRDTILSLTPYAGKLAHLFAPDVAGLASFAVGPGMTIEPNARFTLLSRQGAPA